MSTSLNVVSMAALFCASFRRSAIRLRSRVMRTRSSRPDGRAISAGTGTSARAGGGAGRVSTGRASSAATGFASGEAASAANTSPLVTLPFGPVGATRARSIPRSSAILRAAGPACSAPLPLPLASSRFAAAVSAVAGPLPSFSTFSSGAWATSRLGVGGAAAPAPSSIRPSTAPTSTSLPSSTATSASRPLAGALTSSVTLSVSSSTSGSSAATASPAFLNQRATVASVTDSPSVGTLISTDIEPSSPGRGPALDGDHVLAELVLLPRVLRVGACPRGAPGPPPGVGEPPLRDPDRLHQVLGPRRHEEPSAHVARLLLAPHVARLLGVAPQLALERHLRERRQLLEPDQRHLAIESPLLARLLQIVEHLAGAQDHPLDLPVGLGRRRLVEDAVEAAARAHVLERRYAPLVPQQRLRRHDDQRLAEIPVQLPPQGVEVAGQRAGVDDRHVVLGVELEPALEPGRAVLGPLALVAVRQQADQARQAEPLALARADELVEVDLRPVGEVAELRLPAGQAARVGQAVAILEAQHARLGEQAVEYLGQGLPRSQVLERDVALLRELVVDDGVALAEGAAPHVLAR